MSTKKQTPKSLEVSENNKPHKNSSLLLSLPFDILYEIFCWLSIKELANFSRCSRTCHFLSCDDRLWRKITQRSNLQNCTCCMEKFDFNNLSCGFKIFFCKLSRPHFFEYGNEDEINLIFSNKIKKNNQNNNNSKTHKIELLPNSKNNLLNHLYTNEEKLPHLPGKSLWFGGEYLTFHKFPNLVNQSSLTFEILILGGRVCASPLFNVLTESKNPNLLFVSQCREKKSKDEVLYKLHLDNNNIKKINIEITSSSSKSEIDNYKNNNSISSPNERSRLTSSTNSIKKTISSSLLKNFLKNEKNQSKSEDLSPQDSPRKKSFLFKNFLKTEKNDNPLLKSHIFLDILMAIGDQVSPFYRQTVVAKGKGFVVVYNTRNMSTFLDAQKHIFAIFRLKKFFYGIPSLEHPGVVLVGIDSQKSELALEDTNKHVNYELAKKFAKKPTEEDGEIPLIIYSDQNGDVENFWMALHPFLISFLEFSKFRHAFFKSGKKIQQNGRKEESEWDFE